MYVVFFILLDRARDKNSKEIVALKKVRMENEVHGVPLSSLREIFLLKRLNHPNIVQVKEVAVGASLSNIFLVMEYVEQDISLLMEHPSVKQFQPSEVKCLMKQLICGLFHLHSNHIIHRDLKLSNLLLSNQGILKIADFGMARTVAHNMTPDVVTLWYRAPELLFGELVYSYETDMWSVGCIFGEFLQHKPLFPGSTVPEQIMKITALLGSPSLSWSGFDKLPGAKTLSFSKDAPCKIEEHFSRADSSSLVLLKALLCYDPLTRLSSASCMDHFYFTERPKPCDPRMLPSYPEIRNRLNPVEQ